jgi:BirA family biotin operon repressor/biotin-[acetyl-CoA-carboxylase] ligase
MIESHKESLTQWFDLTRFEHELKVRKLRWGRPARLLECTPSTNDLALEGIESGKPTGAIWIAREQDAGRGRRGRKWFAAPGDALLLSMLLKPPSKVRMDLLPIAAGLALREVVEKSLNLSGNHFARVCVKWPNDVYIDERKVAGILIEGRGSKDGTFAFAVGIGLNILTREFPGDLPRATSLRLEGFKNEQLSFEEITADLLSELEKRMSLLLSRGTSALLEELVPHDFLLGRRVAIDGRTGVARGFNADGQLLLEDDAGNLHALLSGTVEEKEVVPPTEEQIGCAR